TGYESLLFERPKLYDVLLKQIPSEKITMGKRVLKIEEKDDQVIIHCADNTSFEGDIVVGADGAYSSVRQSIYKRMENMGTLPKSDKDGHSIGSICTVGVAQLPDLEKYPSLQANRSSFAVTLGENLRSCSIISVPGNRVCWALGKQVSSQTEPNDEKFRNNEWAISQANDSMLEEFRSLKCPWGGTMGELIDLTDKNLISKVFLEEKLFKTWYFGRTVLIGDGAINAIEDAVIIANCIANMTDKTQKSVDEAFKSYYRQRYHPSQKSYQRSSIWHRVNYGQFWMDRLLRQIMIKYMPRWAHSWVSTKTLTYRPQAQWLPLVQNKGRMQVMPQEFEKYQRIKSKRVNVETEKTSTPKAV
ncbi:hypothetical protein BX616_002500, partial [Lobosporangium transversale]